MVYFDCCSLLFRSRWATWFTRSYRRFFAVTWNDCLQWKHRRILYLLHGFLRWFEWICWSCCKLLKININSLLFYDTLNTWWEYWLLSIRAVHISKSEMMCLVENWRVSIVVVIVVGFKLLKLGWIEVLVHIIYALVLDLHVIYPGCSFSFLLLLELVSDRIAWAHSNHQLWCLRLNLFHLVLFVVGVFVHVNLDGTLLCCHCGPDCWSFLTVRCFYGYLQSLCSDFLRPLFTYQFGTAASLSSFWCFFIWLLQIEHDLLMMSCLAALCAVHINFK